MCTNNTISFKMLQSSIKDKLLKNFNYTVQSVSVGLKKMLSCQKVKIVIS